MLEESKSGSGASRSSSGGGTSSSGGARKKPATRSRTSGASGTARKRSTTGSSAAKRASTAKKTSTTSGSSTTRARTATKRPAARKTSGGAKTTGRAQGNGAGGRTASRPASRERRLSETAPVGDLVARTARDYNEAKKALSALWQDAAKTTYSAFNTIAANVEKRFDESRKVISEIDVRYALDKSQEKLKQVGQSTTATAQSMGRQVKLLYQMLKDSTAGRFKAPWATVSAITAALLYFISPIDVLPDFIPGAGLIDDALVISLCISVIRMDLKRYAKEMNLDLADYALAKK